MCGISMNGIYLSLNQWVAGSSPAEETGFILNRKMAKWDDCFAIFHFTFSPFCYLPFNI